MGSADPEQVVDDLVKIAYAEGGLDNITIILADVVDDGPAGETMVLGAAAEIDLDVAADDIDDTRQIPTGPRPDPGAREKAELARYQPTTKGRGGAWVKVILGIVLPVLVIGGGLFGWYGYVQTKYYVGANDDLVTVFRGLPDTVLGVRLSTPIEVHNTKVSDLPLFYQDKVRSAIVVPDLQAAATTTEELRVLAQRCIAQREARATATAAPTPSDSASPSPATSATATGKAGPTPSTSPSPTVSPTPSVTPSADTPQAPEDC